MSPEFSFTASAECERCGAWLSASDDECEHCSHKRLQRYHFEHLNGSVETVFAISPVRAWAALLDKVDDPLPYTQVETGFTSLHFKQFGYDVTDADELRPNG